MPFPTANFAKWKVDSQGFVNAGEVDRFNWSLDLWANEIEHYMSNFLLQDEIAIVNASGTLTNPPVAPGVAAVPGVTATLSVRAGDIVKVSTICDLRLTSAAAVGSLGIRTWLYANGVQQPDSAFLWENPFPANTFLAAITSQQYLLPITADNDSYVIMMQGSMIVAQPVGSTGQVFFDHTNMIYEIYRQ